MGYSIQNSETGEVIYIRTDTANVMERSYDAETGEPIMDEIKVCYLKQKHFQVPKKLLRGSPCEEFEKEILGKCEEIYKELYGKISKESNFKHEIDKSKKQVHERDDFINMEGVSKDITSGYNKSNYRILFLRTSFFFNIYAALIIMVLEMFLHLWAYLKNGLNMHIVTSQFCAKCRSEADVEVSIFLSMMLARQSIEI